MAVGPELQFYTLVVVSFLVLVAILRYVMRLRAQSQKTWKVIAVASAVVFGGMLFARYGAQSGLPWWIYYTIPMVLTVSLPPIAFSMSIRETSWYIVLAFLSAPFIHLVFSFFLGWREYMPFLHIPSLWDVSKSAPSSLTRVLQ